MRVQILFTAICFLPFLLGSLVLSAQEFSFTLHFEDSVGNTDSLVLGFDEMGTHLIDEAFGEENIIGQPWNDDFEVRVTDQWIQSMGGASIHSKKQIINRFDDEHSIVGIDIKTDNWPVKASWEETLFTEAIEFSVFTSIHPGGWWDTGSPSNLSRKFLSSDGMVAFSNNVHVQGCLDNAYCYLTEEEEEVSNFWLAFGNYNYTNTKEVQWPDKVSIFPNPTSGQVRFKSFLGQYTADKVKLFDQWGNVLLEKDQVSSLDINHLPPGVYLVVITNSNGQQLAERLVKM